MDPHAIRSLVPEHFDVDLYEGHAWVGLVPFTMPDFRPACLPPGPRVASFHECNVRTYVRHGDVPGVWFFSLDAASRLAVWSARRFFHLNYRFARIDLETDGETVRYAVQRVGEPASRLRCAWRVGVPRPPAQPGALDHFVTERYSLFAVDRRGRPRRGRVEHRPWPLRYAELLELDDGLVAAAGIRVPDEAPIVYAADPIEVTAGWLGN